MKLYIGNFRLGEVPLITGVLTDSDIPNINQDLLIPADLIELRIDMFDDVSAEHVGNAFKICRNNFKKPLIATVRDIKEGGQREIKDRLGLYSAAAPFSDAIDVEIDSGDIWEEVKMLCSTHKRLLIGSYHNFHATPDGKFLDDIVSKGKDIGADIVKVAAMAKDREDLISLLTFTLRHRDNGIITMSMGDKGLPSRVFSPLLGSLMTYGYISHPSAPGQLSVNELMYIFKKLNIR
ncbi:type I 3-dehydroquinate dehydratase [Thermodesulfovibrionales bacterium]|nr:type I 3-dehydroquinate dehydratase [Thermodesulfovibrionales bacterium]